MRGSKNGTPDRFAIIRGQIIFVEVKRAGQKSNDAQTNQQNILRYSGAIVIVADSLDKFISEFSAIRAIIEESKQNKEMKIYD